MTFLNNYHYDKLLTSGLASLYTSRTMLLVAEGFLGLFLPVFLLIQYDSLTKTIIFYLISWSAYIFLTAPGSKIMNYIGIKYSLIFSLPMLILFYLSLYFFENDVLLWSIMAIMSITLYRMLYWVPYHTEFAQLTMAKIRGKQLSVLDGLTSLLGVIIPFVSGFLIYHFGFKIVFVISIIVLFMAIIPLLFLKESHEQFSWTYWQTWGEYFKKKNRRMMVAYMADGAENWIGAVLWPIFIWQLLNGQFVQVGIITSLVTLIAVVFKLFVGDLTDRLNKRKMIRIGSILYSIGWLAKTFINTAFQIFVASTLHNFAMIAVKIPFDALVYEKMSNSGHYIDEYSTLREMYLQTGRVLVILIVLLLLNYFPLQIVFILAAAASLLINLLPDQREHENK